MRIQYVLYIFLSIIILYHGISTFLQFGIEKNISGRSISLGRDALRIIIICGSMIRKRKEIRTYVQKNKNIIITIVLFIVSAILVSLYNQKSTFDILIGLKYSILPFAILISAIFIGHISTEVDTNNIYKYIRVCIYSIVIGGIARQATKHVWPDFFYHIGYGPVGDFQAGTSPPLYYRTGKGGRPRLSGFFAGPNNYGYFLVAFFPLIRGHIQQLRKEKSIKRTYWIYPTLYILSIVGTISRGARVATAILGCIYARPRIQKHRKIGRTILGVGILGFMGVSILKRESTQEHIEKTRASISYVIQKPGGYGLGSSGPAIHYNGTILPENFYIQVMIDTGILGWILWCGIMLQIFRNIRSTQKNIKGNVHKKIYLALARGCVGLCIEGVFLHVFEDSMVNYFFFIARGYMIGYTQNHFLTKKQ